MAACSDIKEIGLVLDKELNIVLEKNYRIKDNIKENIKEKNLEVLRVISERTKNKESCDLNSILLNVDSDSLDNSQWRIHGAGLGGLTTPLETGWKFFGCDFFVVQCDGGAISREWAFGT